MVKILDRAVSKPHSIVGRGAYGTRRVSQHVINPNDASIFQTYDWGMRVTHWHQPSNRQTESQQSWRSVFSMAVHGWHGLNDDERDAWRESAKGYRDSAAMTGFNLYVSRWLLGLPLSPP